VLSAGLSTYRVVLDLAALEATSTLQWALGLVLPQVASSGLLLVCLLVVVLVANLIYWPVMALLGLLMAVMRLSLVVNLLMVSVDPWLFPVVRLRSDSVATQ